MKKMFLTIIASACCYSYLAIKQPDHTPLSWIIPYTKFECGGNEVSNDALNALNKLRLEAKQRYRVVSGFRRVDKNKKVGGASNSQHIHGNAFDLLVKIDDRSKFYKAAVNAGFTGFGWGSNTVHIDIGKKRWWTYDDSGKAVSGNRKYKYLNKAPDNFKTN